MAESRRIRIVQATYELLAEVMHLPKDSRILEARAHFDRPGVLELIVESPDFPEVPEGHVLQRGSYSVQIEMHDCPADGSRWKEVSFKEWLF